jgi:P4 family phage/plasmid primase-like protien
MEKMSSIKDAFLYYSKELNLPVFPVCSPDYHKRTSRHDAACNRPGKKPLVKEWQKATVPNEEQIDKWMKKIPDCNIGLLLGKASGLCGIDVDGEEGEALLTEMSNGNLPLTPQFTTPNGGIRYLYRIPSGFTMRKYTLSGSAAHAECALLGEGQMTVLPPSKLAKGSYTWVTGRSPDDVPFADAPAWMIERMTKQQPSSQQPDTVQHVLDTLTMSCSQFANDWLIQQTTGLPEMDWFHWISLFTNAGHTETAHAFSATSAKHNANSDNRIRQLSQKQCGLVRCATIGCTEEQIKACFAGSLRTNKKGEIINSPGSFIRRPDTSKLDQSELEEIGFLFKYDKPFGINGNLFASHILKHHDLLYTAGERFYLWEKGVWKYIDGNELSRKLRQFLHQYVPNLWTLKIEESYLEALKREAPRVDRLDANRQYLNLENGMLNLKTFELEPHQKEFYSSIRIPIVYDASATCPTFHQFLLDVFEGDQERIDLTGEILGYCLTAETKAQKAFLFYGKGSNGKSVLADIVMQLCGKENCSTVPLPELSRSFARLDLVDKLVNISTENEVGQNELDTTYFKSITSGDPIRVEIKHGNGFQYQPYCKLLFACNNLPYTKDKSYGFMRRLIILPFYKTFEGKQVDVHLPDKLKAELPGILNFALQGLKRLSSNQFVFTHSAAVEQAVNDYADRLNPIRIFVDDWIEPATEDTFIYNKDLRTKFNTWASENGYMTNYSDRRFADEVRNVLQEKRIPFKSGKGAKGARGIRQIRWKEQVTQASRAMSLGEEEPEEVDFMDSFDW